jgi:hypothetical protein
MIALQAYAQGKGNPPQSKSDVKNHVFHANEQVDDKYYPYLQGKDVQRYGINWSGDYLRYGKHLAEPQKLSRFTGPRIIVREITQKTPHLLAATYTDQTLLYNKSVLHILPTDASSEKELLALLCILNSPLASFCIAFRGRKSQRKLFPKIVNGDLKSLSLPLAFDKHVKLLANAAKALLDVRDEETRLRLEGEANSAVFVAYSLSREMRESLEDALRTSVI